MNIFTLTLLGALVNAQAFGEEQNPEWTNWTTWSPCSKTCGEGTRTRLRACQGFAFGNCPGSSSETDKCNEVLCPTWSKWSDWSDCSASCEGGTQSRTRQCSNDAENDCPGSATDIQQCNRETCGPNFLYWNGHVGIFPRSTYMEDRDLWFISGETDLEKCVNYCSKVKDCVATYAESRHWTQTGENWGYSCRLATSYYVRGSKPYDWSGPEQFKTYSFAVQKDFYEENSSLFNSEPDGSTAQIASTANEGLCDAAETGFGMVDYRKFNGIEFASIKKENIIQDEGENECPKSCFETAGCSAFFVENNDCTLVIGPNYAIENNAVAQSGLLDGVCPSSAFQNTFIRRSQFYCLIFTPNEADSLADDIVEFNTGNPNTRLHAWLFKTEKTNKKQMLASSQYVSLSMLDLDGFDSRYRQVIFSIETHIRVGTNQISRKRRSNGKQSGKQRSILRTNGDIMAKIEEIEQKASQFILDGEMKLPDGVQVAATSPIETVEFVQTAADGSITADCSTGSCQCSVGFFDYGNGCVETNEDQTITPSIATTTSTSTLTFSTTSTTEITSTSTSTTPNTTIVSITTTKTIKPTSATWNNGSESVRYWLTALVDDKLQAVFEHQRPKRARNHLFKKWKNLSDRFVRRYRSMIDNGCNFPDTYDEYSVDFNSVSNPVCYDIDQVNIAFGNWGRQFTYDCKKTKRGMQSRWFDKYLEKVQRVYAKTLFRLKCPQNN